MRICHYTDVDLTSVHPLIGGGVETSIRHQRKALDRVGVDWTDDPGEAFDILHINQIGPKSLFQMKKAQQTGKKVVIHVHWTAPNFRGSFRFSNLLAPAVDTYTMYFYDNADHLIAVSEHTRDFLEDNGADPPTSVISNGVDIEYLQGYEELDRDQLREKYGTGDSPVVVNLAALFPRKGVEAFIEAAEAIPDAEFRWFGPSHSLLTPNSVERRIEDAPANFRYPGYVDDKREALALGDIFLFPSVNETQGMSILEAMACGLPVVVRDNPEYAGWLEHGHNCLKADSEEALIEHVERLKDDPALREELGTNAEATAKEHRLEAIGSQLRQTYEQVLER